MTIRSALSVTYADVAPQWMIPRAAGAASPKTRTCAMTSWRVFSSSRAAASKSTSDRCARISPIASSEIGRPSRRSSSASHSQSSRQVSNFRWAEKSRTMSAEA